MTRGLLAIALVSAVLPGPTSAKGYGRSGVYDVLVTPARDWTSDFPLSHGVPIVNYPPPIGRKRNPVTTAQYGLTSWSLWVTYGDARRLRAARRAGDWLVRTQRRDGTWGYGFAYTVPGTTMVLDKGWASALAQGQAVSLLERLYRKTRRAKYLRAAEHALPSMGRSVRHGGLARWHRGRIWYEEYPSSRPSLVLNGELQALIGLYDLAGRSRSAARLFKRGVASLSRSLRDFDDGHGRSWYDLAFLAGFSYVHNPPTYDALIERALRDLADVTGRHRFRRYADRWTVGA